MVITSSHPDEGLSKALDMLNEVGVEENSRNGTVLTCPIPVIMAHYAPRQRVSFCPRRDANPFFHLFEAMWMLGGRNDVAFVSQFNSNIKNYSDDGRIFHGAYGHRWRHAFDCDQLKEIIQLFKDDPTTRRVVLQMWDANQDLGATALPGVPSKDLPCNTHAYFRVVEGTLGLTVCNRSNDLVWGAYGANVVHFSILQEYLAEQIGLQVGVYNQFSNNLHLYEKHWGMLEEAPMVVPVYPKCTPLGSTTPGWDADLDAFLHRYDLLGHHYKTNWFRNVIAPLGHAYWNYKSGRIEAAIDFANQCEAADWREASIAWLERRVK